MNQKELKELIEFVIEKDIAEFELERGDLKIRIKRAGEAAAPAEVRYMAAPIAAPVPTASAQPAATAAPAAPKESAPVSEEDLFMAKSPIVGTFYEAGSPGAPPFFKVGDTVEAGQVLCIIEAMKLMNEIEAEVSGEIVKRFVNNGQPVEYGQPLFAIRPRK
jgi:acetyl-CoA carboxylase biotin carboxyl carrier protein